jgi:hypothetical protein
MRGDDTLQQPGRQHALPEETPTAMTHADRVSIEHFVRGTLGCGCPDEVFQSIAISHLPAVAGRPPIVQLLVGSRLLIHVVAPPAAIPGNGWIEQLAAHGRAARDRHGYNRFRLVIASPVPPDSVRDLQERFARAMVGDEKAHLHFVGQDQLPAGLELPAPAAQVPSEPLRAAAK